MGRRNLNDHKGVIMSNVYRSMTIACLILASLAIAIIAGCAFQAQKTSKKLAVSEIIVPEQGLAFKTEDGKIILVITATEDGGTLGILNNQEKTVASMGTSEYGGALFMHNNQEKWVVAISAYKNGGALGIQDNRGNIIWSKP